MIGGVCVPNKSELKKKELMKKGFRNLLITLIVIAILFYLIIDNYGSVSPEDLVRNAQTLDLSKKTQEDPRMDIYRQKVNSISKKVDLISEYTKEWNINLGKIGEDKLDNAIKIRNDFYEVCMRTNYEIEDFNSWFEENRDFGATKGSPVDIPKLYEDFNNIISFCNDNLKIMDTSVQELQQGEIGEKILKGLFNVLTRGLI